MTKFHNKENKITKPISKNLNENIETLNYLFKNSNDIISRKFTIGGEHKVTIYLLYVDNMINIDQVNDAILRYLLFNMDELPEKDKFEYVKEKGIKSADMSVDTNMNDAVQSILSGETVIFMEGVEKALSVSIKSFPNRGVPETKNEVTVRGSREGFGETLFSNKVLLRRRIKDSNLKIKNSKVGIRTQTDIAIVYMDDIAKPELVEEVENRINEYMIDGILDSGMLEQLMEKNIYSPFPEFQATERPDKAASALLEGRVVILVDNSPMAIIAPATANSFFQASDDYYERWEVASFTRLLRYFGAFLTMAFPGLYIAVINYQPELLSSSMALTFSAAREGVPFSVLFEIIIMEIAFQLILEAGIRLPGPMGSTLGIVGGLIIGDAAVSANIVSPIVVIVIALTAITAFTVPNEAFAAAFRLIRYIVIFLSSFLGLFGFIVGLMLILIHLAGLKSFGVPYLMPFDASAINSGSDMQDSLIRFPLKELKNRPIFSRKEQRTRLVKNKKNKK